MIDNNNDYNDDNKELTEPTTNNKQQQQLVERQITGGITIFDNTIHFTTHIDALLVFVNQKRERQ